MPAAESTSAIRQQIFHGSPVMFPRCEDCLATFVFKEGDWHKSAPEIPTACPSSRE